MRKETNFSYRYVYAGYELLLLLLAGSGCPRLAQMAMVESAVRVADRVAALLAAYETEEAQALETCDFAVVSKLKLSRDVFRETLLSRPDLVKLVFQATSPERSGETVFPGSCAPIQDR